MKLIKLIFISACLAASIQTVAQEVGTTDVYYGIELIPVSTTPGDTNTIFQVVVIMDSTDLQLFSDISVENSKKSKDLKVTKEERKDNPRIKVKNKNYQLDMQEWSEDEELKVMAKKPDGTKVKLKKHPRGSEFTHKVVTLKTTTRDLKKHEGPEIVEDENEQ